MLEDALKAKIPIISVMTDDPVNFPQALTVLAGRKACPWPVEVGKSRPKPGPFLYWAYGLKDVTREDYENLHGEDGQLVVANPEKPSPLVFSAGVMPTPPLLIKNYLSEFVVDKDVPEVMQALKGLSLKTAAEVVQLTMVRVGNYLPAELRRTRSVVGGTLNGLETLDTDIQFYAAPPEVTEWLKLNAKYFNQPGVPFELMPRGLLFAGPPGVGKTMGARYLAKHFQVPLFRMNVATALNKYIGESENRIHQILQMVDRESPCVLLIDEVEKVFNVEDDNSKVIERILSVLLWWLAEHRTQVVVVMTTNNLEAIPPEVYREGRVDAVVKIDRMERDVALAFAGKVYENLLKKKPITSRQASLLAALVALPTSTYTPAQVANMVYTEIKLGDWWKT